MIQWNYKSVMKKSNGYEDVLNELKFYNKEKFINSDKDEQQNIIDSIFDIYRTKNIFPIQYYNNEGIDEEIKKCISKKVNIEDNILNIKNNTGNSLCRFLFPNLQLVDVRGHNNNNMWCRFYDDHKLKRTIDFSLRYRKSATPSEIRGSLEMIEHGIPNNFYPMRAKAIYEKYCPINGIIYDYSCGFGGRMLGALSSKNNYTYLGVEPNMETYTHLNELGMHIERVTGRNDSYKLFCMCSEDFETDAESVDFAFSSPPYFNLEIYSNEPTQCYNKFPILDDWFNGYVYPTIKNIYNMLKFKSYYAVNIADFKIGKNYINYVDRWIEISKQVGFEYVEQIHMNLKARSGDGHAGSGTSDKKEGIFIFRK